IAEAEEPTDVLESSLRRARRVLFHERVPKLPDLVHAELLQEAVPLLGAETEEQPLDRVPHLLQGFRVQVPSFAIRDELLNGFLEGRDLRSYDADLSGGLPRPNQI